MYKTCLLLNIVYLKEKKKKEEKSYWIHKCIQKKNYTHAC